MNILHRFTGKALAAVVAAALGAALTAIATLPTPARAADIDLFTTGSREAAAPNVYIMIDNSANWNSTIQDDAGNKTSKRIMEEEALRAVFGGATNELLGESGNTDNPIKIRVGFGLFSSSNSPRGGKVYEAIEDFDSDHQADIMSVVDEIGASGDPLKTNNAPYALSFNEALAYFAGAAPVSGTQDGDHDTEAVVSANDGTRSYVSPAASNCGKNYIILIGNGEPDSGEDNDAEAKLDAHGGRLAGDPIDIDPDNFEANWADEYARFLAGSDILPESVRGDFERNVRTYVIDVFDDESNQKDTQKFKAARKWLDKIADMGGGNYYPANDAEGIKTAFEKIKSELFAEDSVFAASTLPVSVNVRGTNLNQVYMGVFRPNATGATRWQGNLKLYQLAAVDEDTAVLADSNGERAQNQSSGFIRHTALSFWTHSSSYWDFDPRGEPESVSDAPDGAVVEKGGVHQRIRDVHGADPVARPLYTYSGDDCPDGGCVFEDFDIAHSAVSGSSLGTADSTEAANLVDWMHGLNNVSDTNDPDTDTTATIRPSVHGDVLHSRPAVVNYGDIDGDDESDVVAYYGANDGIFHAIEGGKDGADGTELWGFIPPEFFGRLKALRDLADGKEYFADGGIGTFQRDVDGDGVIEPVADGDQVHLYVSMRRGGRFIYALDVSDPADPRFLWKRGHNDDGFSELGQTWSNPEVSRIQYTDTNGDTATREVLVFGGGYDPGADDPGATGSRSMGRGLFVVDAMTGEPIWQAGASPSGATVNHTVADMTYSIPSDVTVLDRDDNGFADRVYVGDTGGQVWRADISGPPADWQVHKLASDGAAAGQPERKFLYPPDVVFKHEPGGERFDAVLLGSGDREDPFETSVTNRFYMFKDDYHLTTTFGADYPFTEADLFDATDNVIQVGTETEQQTATNDLANAKGWYIDLEAGGAGTGEKVVSSAVTLGGTVFFNTNQPPDSSSDCSQNLGIARNYELDFEDATATTENNETDGMQTEDRYSRAEGGGFPPSPVPVIVEIDGRMYEVVLSGTEAKMPPSTSMGRRNPVYWTTDIDG